MSGWMLHQNTRRTSDRPSYYYAKRLLDSFMALVALITLSPLLLIVAILIKATSPGPVFFTQRRMGAKRHIVEDVAGKVVVWEPVEFSIYKFRTMFHNVDQSRHKEQVLAFVSGELDVKIDDTSTAKIEDDPRITPFGKFLRRTSIDELPQILNVLRGQMSIVGPRPVPLYEAELYQEAHMERLTVMPGMTGLWQIEGRGRTDFNSMMALDIRYVRTCSLWLDLKIMILTVPVAIFGRGAT